ncbi:diguanylate cyclase domain-containing protein [Telmatospirillum siberiense]|uniref:Diguanylate cyclase n=1 Tax=Telmatospirillum siberiense TaxID=382514 RepID=A0A2N3PMN1_9PROT|nr:diguanylate cyclase [Telmatospirillum siberiense]PKU21667.1 hypothetical protein CWS72_25420 [Telmatospirillum siberiense]
MRHKLAVLLVITAVMTTGGIFVSVLEQNRDLDLRARLLALATDRADTMEREAALALQHLFTLSTLLRQNDGEMENFDAIAGEMIRRTPDGILNLQLAPQGVVRRIFPLAGNEKAIGHNLFQDPNRRAEALKTLESRQPMLAGPFPLVQGGFGVAARLPVFLDKPSGEVFWGFVNAVFPVDRLVAASRLPILASRKISYRLIKPDGGADLPIARSEKPVSGRPLSVKVSMPNSEWRLDVSPENGWQDPPRRMTEVLAVLVAALLAGKIADMTLIQFSMRKALEQLAESDGLTGLYNRRKLDELFLRECERSNRLGTRLAVIIVDLDHFKSINDSFGHLTGDSVLTAVAQCLQHSVRNTDVVGRWGGEEFLILCPGTTLAGARHLAEKLRQEIPRETPNPTVGRTTASFGVAEFNAGEPPQTLLQRADDALYKAKMAGRDCVAVETGATTPDTPGLPDGPIHLDWRTEYDCGHPLIDGQHRNILALTERAVSAAVSGRPKEQVKAGIGALLTTIEQHFRDEERILYEIGFEGAEQHRRQHLALLNKAKEIIVDYEVGILTSGDLFQFLAGELVLRHMNREDAAFAPLLRQIYQQRSAESEPGNSRLAEKISAARWRVPALQTLWLSIVSALLASTMLIPGHFLQRLAWVETGDLAGADGGWRERTGDTDLLSMWRLQLALSGGLFVFLVAGATVFIARTERANRARALAEAGTNSATRKLKAVMETSFEGIVITRQGNIIEANDQFLSMTGYERKEIIGKDVEPLLPPSERPAIMHNIMHGKESLTEHTMIAKDGRILFIEAHGRTITTSGQMERITTLRDITALKNHQQQLDRAAHFDPLTVLPNRSHFVDHLRQALHQCRKRKQPLAVAYLDLDAFASLNDRHGRYLGDEMLTLLGQRIRMSLRDEDMIGRIGSDEFAIILSGVGRDGNPHPIMERLLNIVSARATLAGQRIATSASIGIAFFPGDGGDPDQLLQRSNQAMYAAKEAGGNAYHLFDSDTEWENTAGKDIRRSPEN